MGKTGIHIYSSGNINGYKDVIKSSKMPKDTVNSFMSTFFVLPDLLAYPYTTDPQFKTC